MIEPLPSALARVSAMLNSPLTIRRIVFSGRQRAKQPNFQRVDIRPVELRGQVHLQVVSHDGKQDFTKNYLPQDFPLLELMNQGFGNLIVESSEEELILRVTKSGDAQVNIKSLANKAESIDLSHDRKKTRYLSEEEPIFRELGISDHTGKLKASRTDKFVQVNEFLKIIDHALTELERTKRVDPTAPLNLVDLGCGHAYLTFAAHQYLLNKGISVSTVGVDSRIDSRDRNQEIARQSKLSNEINFVADKITTYPIHSTDITVALHACDTATDDAIAWAIASKSQVILVAPCCHHDIQKQIKKSPKPWNIATKHGILKERVGDILTDAIRAQVLRILGYRTDVIEFVAGDHTPRNLMIRAIYSGASPQKQDFEELDALIEQWEIEPALVSRLSAAITAQRNSALS